MIILLYYFRLRMSTFFDGFGKKASGTSSAFIVFYPHKKKSRQTGSSHKEIYLMLGRGELCSPARDRRSLLRTQIVSQ